MKKRIASGLIAVSLLAATVLSATVISLPEAKAAGLVTPTTTAAAAETAANNGAPAFEQQIKVANGTSGNLGIEGISLPSLTYSYKLTPVTDTKIIPSGGVYSTETADFPNNAAGNSTEQNAVISGIGNGGQSDSDGIYTVNLAVQHLFEDPTTVTFPTADTVLCYKLNMTGIYLENKDGEAVLNLTDGVTGFTTKPDVTTIYCDIYIDENKKIGKVLFWNESRTGKINGFSDGYVDGYEPTSYIATAASSSSTPGLLTYTVYDAEFTTDYIGTSKTSDDFTYNINFTNLPWWLDKGNLLDQTTVAGGNQWTSTDSAVDGNVVLSGKLKSNDAVYVVGIPVIGFDVSAAPSMGVTMQFTSLNGKTHANDDATIAKYVKRTYMGSTTQIGSETNSLTLFNQLGNRTEYKDVAFAWDNTNNYYLGTSDASTTIKASNSDSDNNLRMVMFDPTNAIVVGVAMDFLPGILMIGLALGSAVTIGLSRRRDVAF